MTGAIDRDARFSVLGARCSVLGASVQSEAAPPSGWGFDTPTNRDLLVRILKLVPQEVLTVCGWLDTLARRHRRVERVEAMGFPESTADFHRDFSAFATFGA